MWPRELEDRRGRSDLQLIDLPEGETRENWLRQPQGEGLFSTNAEAQPQTHKVRHR